MGLLEAKMDKKELNNSH